ncbi:MAG: hypothetical protein AB7O56_09270 [Bauldia sp.]
MEGEAEVTTEGAAEAAAIGTFLGALIATFLISRLFLWLLRGRVSEPLRLAIAHLASIAIIFVAVGFTSNAGSGFDAAAVVPYLIPQSIWVVVDVVRLARRRAAPSA